MFEDSFVSARVARAGAGRTRWLLVGSVVVQGAVAGLVIALPMLHPERLVARVSAPTVFVPARPVTPPKVVAREVSRSALATAMPEMTRVVNAPGRIPHGITQEDPGAAPEVGMVGAFSGAGMSGSGLPGVVGEGSSPAHVVAAAPVKKLVRVSAGVTAGLLVEPIRPVYPAIAKAAHVQGEVVVAATISPDGRIEGLRVVSGPAMLRDSAMGDSEGAVSAIFVEWGADGGGDDGYGGVSVGGLRCGKAGLLRG